MNDPAKIAAGLSEAQRVTVSQLTAEWQAGPYMDDALISDLSPLRQAGLVEREFGDMGPAQHSRYQRGIEVRLGACWWFRLTLLGQQVAHILKESHDGR